MAPIVNVVNVVKYSALHMFDICIGLYNPILCIHFTWLVYMSSCTGE